MGLKSALTQHVLGSKSKIARALETATDEDALKWFEKFSAARAIANDWTDIGDQAFMTAIRMEKDYLLFYSHIWKKQYPDAPEDPWEAQTSEEMSDRIQGYLIYRAGHTRKAESGDPIPMCALTLRMWCDVMAITASYHIRGIPPAEHPNRNPIAITGSLANKSDTLSKLLDKFASSYISTHNLPRKRQKNEFFGRAEVSVLEDYIDEVIADDPSKAHYLLLMKGMLQMAFLTCARTGAMSAPSTKAPGTSKQTLHRKDIHILQPSRGVYDLIVDFEHLKGFTQAKHAGITLSPPIPAPSRIGNERHNLASTLIPIFIFEGVLKRKIDYGEYEDIRDMEYFLSLDDHQFYIVEDTQLPLFRTTAKGRSFIVTDKALTTDLVGNFFSRYGLNAGMPNFHIYAMRHGGGCLMRIVGGAEIQKETLNHGASTDVGFFSYNQQLAHIGVARTMMGEFRVEDGDRVRRLGQSDWHQKEASGRAAQVMHKRITEIQHTVAEKKDQKRASKAEYGSVAARFAEEDTLFRKLFNVEREAKANLKDAKKENADNAVIDDLNKVLKIAQDKKRDRQTLLAQRELSAGRKAENTRLLESAPSSIAQHRAASSALTNLLDTDPLQALISAGHSAPTNTSLPSHISTPHHSQSPSTSAGPSSASTSFPPSRVILPLPHRSPSLPRDQTIPQSPSTSTGPSSASTSSLPSRVISPLPHQPIDGSPSLPLDQTISQQAAELWFDTEQDLEDAEEKMIEVMDKEVEETTTEDVYEVRALHGGAKRKSISEKGRKGGAKRMDQPLLPNPMEGYSIFDDTQEMMTIDDEVNKVIQVRLVRMRWNWEKLRHAGAAKETTKEFIARFGYCPYCPLGVVTTMPDVSLLNTQLKFSARVLGMCQGKKAYDNHFTVHHREISHELERGHLPPSTGDIWGASLSDEEERILARLVREGVAGFPSAIDINAEEIDMISRINDQFFP